MKKKISLKWIVYTAYIAACILTASAVTASRFITYKQSEMSTEFAQPVFTYGEKTSETIVLDDISPGGASEYKFKVANGNGAKISDVDLEYTIDVSTTGNLPLTFYLVAGQANEGKPVQTGAAATMWEGGYMPFGQAVEHDYVLAAVWENVDEKSQNGEYDGEMDLITLAISWQAAIM